ncbi:MAG: flagellar biosynthetic protein FliO [Terracidiphilus sp.]
MKTLGFARSTLESIHTQPFRVTSAPSSQATLRVSNSFISTIWRWIKTRQFTRSNTKRLQVTSSVSLGEKRFVAVVQVDGLQFLVGGGASNVALLAQLDRKESFGEVLEQTASVPEKKPVKRANRPIDKPRTRQSKAQWWSTL